MIDSGIPKKKSHNRTDGKKRVNRLPKQRLLSNIEIRFVYEGELVGEWFSISDAGYGTSIIIPNEKFNVIRLEYRDTSEL